MFILAVQGTTSCLSNVVVGFFIVHILLLYMSSFSKICADVGA